MSEASSESDGSRAERASTTPASAPSTAAPATPSDGCRASASRTAVTGSRSSGFARCGADVLVLAAATGLAGYDERPELDDRQWRTLIGTAGRIAEVAAGHGVRTVLHPHVGTHVETEAEVERFLAFVESSERGVPA